MKRVLVFGSTSAIAHAAARQWVARGCSLHLVGRNLGKLEANGLDLVARKSPDAKVTWAQADLDDVGLHAGLIRDAHAALGGIDGVLVAQGSLPDQAACERDTALALRELHTNGTAVVALCAELGNMLATQGFGCLAVITSVAGDRGRQSNFVYGAAKGLVSRYLQGLRNKLYASNICVVDIRPGFVDTPMTASIARKGALWATPEAVATGIVKAMDARGDIVYLPGFWRFIMLIIKLLPEALFKRLKL